LRDFDRNLAWQAVALVTLEKNGRPQGTLTTEKRGYMRPENSVVTEVGIRSKPYEDFYLILADTDLNRVVAANDPAGQTATFTILIKPLVGLIWAGGFLLTIGSLIGLWPSTERVRAPSTSRRPPSATEPVPAGD
jgi:cytochrome c biogenesis factor